jgi:hypothetical protein
MIPAPTPEQIALLERLDDVVKKRHAAPPSEKARIHEELSEVLTALVVSVLVKPKGIEARADSPRPRRHDLRGRPRFFPMGFFPMGGPRRTRCTPSAAGSSLATFISCAVTHLSIADRWKRQSEPTRNPGKLRSFKSL